MSRTDAHRPVWVHDFFDGTIQHDHRSGVCVEETLERVRWEANSRSKRYRHDPACPRVSYDVRHCDGPDSLGYRCWTVIKATDVCNGHNVRRYDETVPCAVCDLIPEPATCNYRIPGRYYWRLTKLYGEHVPADVVNMYEHVDRQKTRLALRDAARDWNANGETDIEPDVTQHRHAASWYYW